MRLAHHAIRGLARLYPYEVTTSSQFGDAVRFIEWPHEPDTVVRAGYGAGILALLLLVPLHLLGVPLLANIGIVLVVSLVCVQGIHSTPTVIAAFARTRALGDLPNLIGRAVLRMEIEPATENAVNFAAETGQGPLAESLSSHIDAALGTPQTGLLSFADDWSEDFPALNRSAHLLATAEDAPEGERSRTLDRSLRAILDGTREQMQDFTSAIRAPTTALYAFGVMLPLALVALVPAAGIAGFSVSIWFFIVFYNFVLPAGLIAAGLWLLVRRPVAFPPPKVTRDHPDVPSTRLPSLLWGGGVGAGMYVAVSRYGPAYLAEIGAFGLGAGVFLLVYYRPIKLVRDYIRNVEQHLPDALYLTGRLVAEEESVESAIVMAADQVPGETGEVFEAATGLQERLHAGVREAFQGEYGALRNIPSPRAKSTTNLLAIASDEGHPAGSAVVSIADHLEELQEVERETKRSLSTVTGTLDHTAAFFGPMVAGATVALADGMVEEGIGAVDDAVQLPTDTLGIVVGIYVITLCFILIPLSLSLKHGFDRSLVGYHIGRALLSAVPIYIATVYFVGQAM